MAYITRAISEQEKLLAIARPHWIYVVKGLVWFLFCMFLGYYLEKLLFYSFGHYAIDFSVDLKFIRFDERHTPLPILFGFLGFMLFWSYFSVFISHEVGLTDQRFIHKKGLFLVKLEQADLVDIRAENISHGLLGWLLRYGYVHLDSRFIDDLYLPAISEPYKLIRLSHLARMRHPDTSLDEKAMTASLKDLAEKEIASRKPPTAKDVHDEFLRLFRRAARNSPKK